MQWIAPHLRNEKGPIATCYPYFSSSYPFSQFLVLGESRFTVKITEQRCTHKIRVPLSHCIILFELRSKFHYRVLASIFIRSLSYFFTELAIHRFRFTFSLRNRNTARSIELQNKKMYARYHLPRIQQTLDFEQRIEN